MQRLPLLLILAAPLPARAAELTWEGFYRARGELFNSLSLSKENVNAEGTATMMDHRLRLQPGFLLSDKVGLFAQFDALAYVPFGDQTRLDTDPLTGEAVPMVLGNRLEPPTTSEDGATLANFQVTRVWGEAHFGNTQLRFGRVPVEWGSGMLYDAGNDPWDEFGDTADRVQVTTKAGMVFLTGAFEKRYEGLASDADDVTAVVGSVTYETERASVGTYHTYRWMKNKSADTKFGAWVGDLWGRADLGPVKIEGEFGAVVGSGDLDTGANDVNLSSFGGLLDASLHADRLRIGLGVGLAGGDKDPEDKKLHTMSFNPDYDVALMMFEEPMPILEPTVKTDANGGRTTDAARTGYSLSNAVYLKPSVGFLIRDDLRADLSFFAAQAAKLPEEERPNKGYGSEIDLNVRYDPMPHFWVSGAGGVFLPGKYYRNYEHPTLGGDFTKPALGFRLLGTVEF